MKTKNILILLMLLMVSIGTASAIGLVPIEQKSDNPIVGFLHQLNLVSGWTSGSFMMTPSDASGISSGTNFYTGDTNKYTGGKQYVSIGADLSGTASQGGIVIVKVGDWVRQQQI